MPLMTESNKINVRVTDDMRQAIDAYCETRKIDRADLIRRLLLNEIGRADLIETMPTRGRKWPAKSETESPPKRKPKKP